MGGDESVRQEGTEQIGEDRHPAEDGERAQDVEGGSREVTEEGREEKEKERNLEQELEEVRAEARENRERFLRTAAELDNFRKRAARMRTEAREEAFRDLILKVAPILDNMRRALSQNSEDVERLRQGVELIYSQFKEVLRGVGLEEIEAVGRPFDPNFHEALMEVDNAEHPPGTVVEEMEKGYTLNDKVVRPARVIVSKGAQDDGEGK